MTKNKKQKTKHGTYPLNGRLMKWLVIVTSLVLVTLGQTNPAVRFDGDVNNAAFFSNGPWPELALTVEFWAATNQ